MSKFETKSNKEVFNKYLSDIYKKKTLYNKEKEGANMIWKVTLKDGREVEVVNSEIGRFVANNKIDKIELKK